MQPVLNYNNNWKPFIFDEEENLIEFTIDSYSNLGRAIQMFCEMHPEATTAKFRIKGDPSAMKNLVTHPNLKKLILNLGVHKAGEDFDFSILENCKNITHLEIWRLANPASIATIEKVAHVRSLKFYQCSKIDSKYFEKFHNLREHIYLP